MKNWHLQWHQKKFAIPLLLAMVLTTVVGVLWIQKIQAGKGANPNKDYQKLLGRWQRADGGYIIDINDVKSNGEMNAAYYNPKSIHVAQSRMSQKKGFMRIFIELRDVNYPGSTYDLIYDSANDVLKGIYFQAVARANYSVIFQRMK